MWDPFHEKGSKSLDTPKDQKQQAQRSRGIYLPRCQMFFILPFWAARRRQNRLEAIATWSTHFAVGMGRSGPG